MPDTPARPSTPPAPSAAGALINPIGAASPALIAQRGAGAIVGAACGDALGVPYEFAATQLTTAPHLIGGGLGPYQPGEWSDDTQLLICIAEITATGADLTTEESLDAIAARYHAWAEAGATDMDAQTRLVIEGYAADTGSWGPARKMRNAAIYFHRRTGRAGGNAVLPRMAAVALTRIHDREWTAAAAREVTTLTHVDELAVDASILWAEAIRTACISAEAGTDQWARLADIRPGLDLIDAGRRADWEEWIDQAQERYFHPPKDNSFVIHTVQAAIGAITATIKDGVSDPARAFGAAVTNAVRVGGDTDTVAATVGALMGALVGAPQIPRQWRTKIHGWPRMRAADLYDLGVASVVAGIVGEQGMHGALVAGVDIHGLLSDNAAAN